MMKALRTVAVIAFTVSCHLDKLLNGGGGVGRPLSTGTPVGLVFSALPRAPQAGRPLGSVQVSVVDSSGQPVAAVDSITVTIALASNPGGAALRGTVSAHPARGIATFSDLRLDRATSGYAFTATASGLSTTSDTFTVVPGPAAQLTFTVEPSTVSQGVVVVPPVVVTAFDSVGNVATDFAGEVRLVLQQNATTVNGGLSGNSTTAVAGVATFGHLQIDSAGAGYTLVAGFGSAAPVAASAPFSVMPPGPPPPPPPAPGPYLLFTDEPVITQAGQPMQTVRVTVYDAAGNQDRTYTGPVTLSIGSNPSGGTLTGGGTITMDLGLGGVVQWERISIDQPGFGYTLRATSPGLREAFSDPLDITAGPPPPANGANGLGFFSQPATTRAGGVIAPALRVGAMAPGGVVATGYNGPVWISLGENPTGATLTGTRRLMAVNGFVTFSDLRIDKPGTGYTLRATAWPLNYTLSARFDVTAP